MKNWLKRLQIKGFVVGVLLTVLVSGTLLVAAQTEMLNAIRVNLNGQLLHFDADSQPFVQGGRTFLPLRALADALGLPVDFDPATNTVYLGDRFAGPGAQPRPLQQAAPFHDRGSNRDMNQNLPFHSNTTWVAVETVTMGGRQYTGALYYQANFTNHSRADGTASVFTLHNLGGQHRMLTGYVGRVDGWELTDATFNVYGDGRLLHTQELSAQALPVPVSIFVEGVSLLRVEFIYPWSSFGDAGYAFSAFVE